MAEKIISSSKNIVFLPTDSYSGVVRIDKTEYESSIFYTTDGSDPNINSLKFSSPILINKGGYHTIKFIEVKEGFENSDIYSKDIFLNYYPIDIGVYKNIKLINQSFIVSDKPIALIKDFVTGENITFYSFNMYKELQDVYFYKLKDKLTSNVIKLYEKNSDIFPVYVLEGSDSSILDIDSNSYSKSKLDFLPEIIKKVSVIIFDNKYKTKKINDDRYAKILKKLPYYLILERDENTVDILDFRKFASKILLTIQHRSDKIFIDNVLKQVYDLEVFGKASINLSENISVAGREEALKYIKILKDFISEEMTSVSSLSPNFSIKG